MRRAVVAGSLLFYSGFLPSDYAGIRLTIKSLDPLNHQTLCEGREGKDSGNREAKSVSPDAVYISLPGRTELINLLSEGKRMYYEPPAVDITRSLMEENNYPNKKKIQNRQKVIFKCR